MTQPDTPPTFGFTSRMHVVPLPRRPSDEASDPLTLIVGLGWPAWVPVEGADRVYLKPSRTRTRVHEEYPAPEWDEDEED